MKDKIVKDKRMHDETKALWHMDRVIDHFDKGKRIAPVHIDMGLAKFCNVNCVFCYGKYQARGKEYIQKDALVNLMKDAGEIGVRSIGYIGDGEPTVNPYWQEGMRAGREAGIDMSISTNGVLLDTPEKRATILDNCEWMRFCFSAGTKEGYKKIHGVDKFDQAVKNIEAIVQEKKDRGSKCEIGLQGVFVPTLMAEEIVEEAKLAVRLGVDYMVMKQCSLPDGSEKVGMMQFDLNDYDKPEIRDALRKAESYSTDKTQIIIKWGLIDQKGRKPYEGCPAIPILLQISGNGDVYPCGHMFWDQGKKLEDRKFEQYKVGNVHTERFKDMIQSDKYWNIVKAMREDFDVHKDCSGCCRHDKLNEFLYNYTENKPSGVNFI